MLENTDVENFQKRLCNDYFKEMRIGDGDGEEAFYVFTLCLFDTFTISINLFFNN